MRDTTPAARAIFLIAILASFYSCSSDATSVRNSPPATPPNQPGPTNPAPQPENLQLVWKVNGNGWSTPSADASTVYFVGANHDVTAVGKSSGVVVWNRTTPSTTLETLGSGSITSDQLLIVGDSNLYAFDKTTGALQWSFIPSTGRTPGLFRPFLSNGNVYAGSASGHIYSINAASGTLNWATAIIPTSTAQSISVYDPVVENGIVFCSFTIFSSGGGAQHTGGLAAVDAASGTVRWVYNFPQVSPTLPSATLQLTLGGNAAIAAARDGTIYAINKLTGEKLWTAPKVAPPSTYSLPIPDQDIRLVAACGASVFAGSTTGYITAYSVSAGTKLWHATAERASASMAIQCDSDFVYVVHAGGQVALFDVGTGVLRYRYDPQSGSGITYGLNLDGRTLYANGSVGKIAIRRP